MPAWARVFILCCVPCRTNIEICRPEFSRSYDTGMAITDGLLCPWARRFSPQRVQDMQFHIDIGIVARVFLATRFTHAFYRSRHTNGPEAFFSLHALRSSILLRHWICRPKTFLTRYLCVGITDRVVTLWANRICFPG